MKKKKNKLQKLKIICFSNFIAPIHPHGGFLLFSYFRHITFKLPAAGTYIPTGEIRASCNTGSQRWVPPEALSHVLDLHDASLQSKISRQHAIFIWNPEGSGDITSVRISNHTENDVKKWL